MNRMVNGFLASLLALAPCVAWAGETIELHVLHASVVKDPIGDQWALSISLTPESKEAFGAFTGRHIGELVDFKIDGNVVMSPVVREPILGGELMISGRFERGELISTAKRVDAADAKVEAEARGPQ
jgi:preprotein translocase subunit SecD